MPRPLAVLSSAGFDKNPLSVLESLLVYAYIGKTNRSSTCKVFSLPELFAAAKSPAYLAEDLQTQITNYLKRSFNEVKVLVDYTVVSDSSYDFTLSCVVVDNGVSYNAAYCLTQGKGLLTSILDLNRQGKNILDGLTITTTEGNHNV